ncbi:MAG: FAD-binding oxidoreductase [Nitrososphaeria archaeon]
MEFETTVIEIIQRTYNVKSFRFKAPKDFNHKPGQFMFVTIKINDTPTKKPFSISCSPTEKGYVEFTKKLTGHEFSNALDTLKIGDWVKIDGPFGNFTFTGEYDKIALLSGGIGITPLRSICRYATDMKLTTRITLLYGNRTEKDIVFREELEQMPKQNPNLKIVLTLDEPDSDWKGYSGVINRDMIRNEIPDYLDRIFYTCGPPAMVRAMDVLLVQLNIPSTRIKKEQWPGY